MKAFAKALKANSPPSVQSTAATALSKLLLTNAFSPSGPNVPPAIKELNESSVETLLQSLIVSYFHPRTRENPVLRQALTYFFPVYCHSRLANTQRMRKVAVPVVRAVLNAAEEFFSLEAEEDSDGDIDETASEREVKALMAGVIGMLVEWTDERRVVGLGGENVLAGGAASSSAHGFVHLALVKDILERILGISTGPNKCSKEEKKLLISMLGKVYISAPTAPSRAGSRAPEGEDVFRSSKQSPREEIDPANVELAETVKELLDQAIEDGVAPDATGRNALVKVKNTILKLLAAVQTHPSNNKDAGRRERAGTEETEYTSAESRHSREPSVIGGHGSVQVVIDNTIVEEDEEEDENDDSKGTVIKTERDSQEPE